MSDNKAFNYPSTSVKGATHYDQEQAPVLLNVYDLMKINDYTTPLGFGIFHTGVEVYGTEFIYVAQSTAEPSIFEVTPRDPHQLGEDVQYRESIHMGYTKYSYEEVRAIIVELGHSFRGDHYHLTTNNCNHFSNALTRALVGRNIPGWVNRLAHIFSHVPLLRRRLPKEVLRPMVETQQQPPEIEERQESTTSENNIRRTD